MNEVKTVTVDPEVELVANQKFREIGRLVNEIQALRKTGIVPVVESASESLEYAEDVMAVTIRHVRQHLQNALSAMENKSLGSVEANQEFASRIRKLLKQTGLRVKCPTTGLPGMLRLRKAGKAKEGIFCIDVTVDGKLTSKTNSTKLPKLELVEENPNNS